MNFGSFLVGLVVGIVATWIFLDREGLIDRITSVRESATEHAPSAEQTANAASTTWSIIRRYWLVLLIIFVLAIWGSYALISQATATPTIQAGFVQLEDACGVTMNVNITSEDVSRGAVTFGSTEACRRTVNLKPAQ